MGICTSVFKDPDSKARRRFVPSPSKEKKTFIAENAVAGFDFGSPGFGSKEETFFDSRAWMDSDCEDDFYSVKGDFTPSRGSTPVHHLSSPSTARLDKHFSFHKSADSQYIPEPSPTGRKKLAELLWETQQSERADPADAAAPGENAGNAEQPPKSLHPATPTSSLSEASSEINTPSRKDKAWKMTAHCCLPMLQNFGLAEGHKMSPPPCAA